MSYRTISPLVFLLIQKAIKDNQPGFRFEKNEFCYCNCATKIAIKVNQPGFRFENEEIFYCNDDIFSLLKKRFKWLLALLMRRHNDDNLGIIFHISPYKHMV